MKEAFVNIRDGRITNPVAVRNLFTLQDGRYLVKVESTKKRSNLQNNFLHGIVLPLVRTGLRDLGYLEIKTDLDAKEVLKSLFLKRVVKSDITGDEIPVAGSTSELKTVEFNEFIEEVRIWAATYLNVQIPEPNEQLELYK